MQKRVPLHKVILDTTALMNLIKHCNDFRGTGVSNGTDIEVSGKLNGVLQSEIGDSSKNNLFINGTLPSTSRTTTKSLKTMIEEEMETQK